MANLVSRRARGSTDPDCTVRFNKRCGCRTHGVEFLFIGFDLSMLPVMLLQVSHSTQHGLVSQGHVVKHRSAILVEQKSSAGILCIRWDRIDNKRSGFAVIYCLSKSMLSLVSVAPKYTTRRNKYA